MVRCPLRRASYVPMKSAALFTLLLILAGTALGQPTATLERIKVNGGITLGYGAEIGRAHV